MSQVLRESSVFEASHPHVTIPPHVLLQAERDAPVDVQMGPLLLEDVRQDVRSRLWLALANDQTLCKLYENGQVCELP